MKKFLSKKWIKRILAVLFVCFVCLSGVSAQSATSSSGNTQMSRSSNITFPNITFSARSPQSGREVAFSVQLLLMLTILTLAPSILILCTCFLRFSIVLDFIKRALSLQQVPPTAVLNGIALFMTLFCMWPTFEKVYNDTFKPLYNNQISIEQAYQNAESPMKKFMAVQMSDDYTYIGTFCKMAKLEKPSNLSEVPMYVMVPAYILHELTAAFKIGVMLFFPFIVIDMIVASILMSMGMMMLPPVQISMPFKLMLFVLVDGWQLLTTQLFMGVIH